MSTSKAEGRREDALAKQRNQMREDFERQKQTLIQETEKARPSSNRFVGQNDSMEDTLKKSTVGLVRLEDFQQRRKELEEAKAREAARTNELKYVVHSYSVVCKTVACRATSLRTDCLPDVEGLFRDEKKVKKRKKTAKSTLSFAMDDEGDESGSPSLNDDEPPVKRPKSRKNPEVDTSFLPDREREEAEDGDDGEDDEGGGSRAEGEDNDARPGAMNGGGGGGAIADARFEETDERGACEEKLETVFAGNTFGVPGNDCV